MLCVLVLIQMQFMHYSQAFIQMQFMHYSQAFIQM